MARFREILNGGAYERWIAAVAAGPRITQGSPLDPFATSLRTIDEAATALFDLLAGRPLTGRAEQRRTDLRSMHLIDDADALTPLGASTRTAWEEHRAGDVTLPQQTERLQHTSVLRCAILIREARRLSEEKYGAYITRWRSLRAHYEATALIESESLLFAYGYLDRTIDGYNPWYSLAGLPPEEFAIPNDDQLTAPERELYRRVRNIATRGTGRREFCAALECHIAPTRAARETFLRKLA